MRDVPGREILRCVTGSRAHGTDTDASDTDRVSVFVPPKSQCIGIEPASRRVQVAREHAAYALRHFVGLALKSSPNILEVLFCDKNCVEIATAEGEILRESRKLFLSKAYVEPYVAYARAQIRKSQRAEQGSARRDLVYVHGYDTKMAAHTVRLLQTALDIVTTGDLPVRRENAGWLMDVRRGKVFLTYERYVAFAEDLIAEVEARGRESSLPEAPEFAAIDALTIRLHEMAWEKP